MDVTEPMHHESERHGGKGIDFSDECRRCSCYPSETRHLPFFHSIHVTLCEEMRILTHPHSQLWQAGAAWRLRSTTDVVFIPPFLSSSILSIFFSLRSLTSPERLNSSRLSPPSKPLYISYGCGYRFSEVSKNPWITTHSCPCVPVRFASKGLLSSRSGSQRPMSLLSRLRLF